MDYEEYKRKALEPIVNYIESVMASYSKEEIEARIKKALPERESGDERITNCIEELLRKASQSYFVDMGTTFAECFAYLEKQKENPKNDSSISTDCVSSAKCENEHNKPGDFVFELRQIISRHWYADMYSECVDDEEEMAREILSLCEKQKEQKPFSQEVFDIAKHEALWGEQQPAEWSEEDNINLNACIQIINDAWEKAQIKELGTTKFAPHYYGDLIDWLKSLQPNWKPSKEQMKALEHFVNGWQDTADGTLESLYKDLKKL